MFVVVVAVVVVVVLVVVAVVVDVVAVVVVVGAVARLAVGNLRLQWARLAACRLFPCYHNLSSTSLLTRVRARAQHIGAGEPQIAVGTACRQKTSAVLQLLYDHHLAHMHLCTC